ncbi:hypothetical protein LINGRAHAP2_LOCUS30643 [Linum grandiflorum]
MQQRSRHWCIQIMNYKLNVPRYLMQQVESDPWMKEKGD